MCIYFCVCVAAAQTKVFTPAHTLLTRFLHGDEKIARATSLLPGTQIHTLLQRSQCSNERGDIFTNSHQHMHIHSIIRMLSFLLLFKRSRWCKSHGDMSNVTRSFMYAHICMNICGHMFIKFMFAAVPGVTLQSLVSYAAAALPLMQLHTDILAPVLKDARDIEKMQISSM